MGKSDFLNFTSEIWGEIIANMFTLLTRRLQWIFLLEMWC